MYIPIYVYRYIYIYTHICIQVYMYIPIYTKYIEICIYTYIYAYTHIYQIYRNVHIYLYAHVLSRYSHLERKATQLKGRVGCRTEVCCAYRYACILLYIIYLTLCISLSIFHPSWTLFPNKSLSLSLSLSHLERREF